MILLVRIVGLMFVLRLVVLRIVRVILRLLIIRIGCVRRVGVVTIVVMSPLILVSLSMMMTTTSERYSLGA
jgi:hypothetical protein